MARNATGIPIAPQCSRQKEALQVLPRRSLARADERARQLARAPTFFFSSPNRSLFACRFPSFRRLHAHQAMHRTVPALRLGHFSFRPCYSQMVSIVLLLVLLLRPTNAAGDLFNYDTTTSFVSEDGRTNSYGPSDWSQVSCEDLESCPGWPEKWLTAIDWGLKENHCKNCAHGCKGVHHQSPIDLSRKWGYTDTPDDAEACIDGHWISYHDGTCSWDMLKAANAFSIERHALRIGQPLERHADGYRLNCTLKSGRRLFPRLDFPYGFSSPFFLSHTEIRVPSEHTQDGKRYHAEVQLPHFFSVSAEENNGVPNQVRLETCKVMCLEVHSNDVYSLIVYRWVQLQYFSRLEEATCRIHISKRSFVSFEKSKTRFERIAT